MGELLDFQKPMVDGVDTADIVDTVDTMGDTVDTLEARGLPMPNLRPKLNPRDLVMLNPRLYLRLTLMLNMDTMDIPPPMGSIIKDTTIGDTMVDSLDTTIIEMF